VGGTRSGATVKIMRVAVKEEGRRKGKERKEMMVGGKKA